MRKEYACLKVNILYSLISISLFVLVSCGGGGDDGGSSPPPPPPPPADYSGTWLTQQVLTRNECHDNLEDTLTTTLIIKHTGDYVLMTFPGSLGIDIRTGSTNDKDGFDVYSTYTDPAKCIITTHTKFENASDGNADIVTSVATQCGKAVCTGAYEGTAVRQSLKTDRSVETESDSTLD